MLGVLAETGGFAAGVFEAVVLRASAFGAACFAAFAGAAGLSPDAVALGAAGALLEDDAPTTLDLKYCPRLYRKFRKLA